jgi:hypothetical protein
MSKALGMRCVWGLCGVLAGVFLFTTAARAEVTTDLSGSIVVFPKVIWTGNTDSSNDRDTVIQLTNTSNQLVHVHCFYVNAQPLDSRFPPGPFNPRRWQVTDFQLWLTRQQPTHWVVSRGRPVNPSDGFGNDGSGLDPGAVPPVPAGFEGELKCVQVETSGGPFGGNALKGEALLRREDGDVSKYNAISILADPDTASADPSQELLLNNTPNTPDNEGEYNSCPNTIMLDHFLDGATNPVIAAVNPDECLDLCDTDTCTLSGDSCTTDADCEGADECPIRTELTLVPCSEDFENIVPGKVTVQFAIVNEFEQNFSASTTVDCWLNVRLADITSSSGTCSGQAGGSCQSDADCIAKTDGGFCEKQSPFSLGNMGTSVAFTRITPVDLDGGVIGMAEELHYSKSATDGIRGASAWAARDLQKSGTRFDATVDLDGGPVIDVIRLPDNGS